VSLDRLAQQHVGRAPVHSAPARRTPLVAVDYGPGGIEKVG
jgi:hypothetical protein